MNILEIELKAGLSDSDTRRVTATLRQLAGPGTAAMRLHAIYYDTADRRLQAAGIALRVRREGRRLVQTVKAGRTALGGFHQVREVEARASSLQPDLAAIPDAALRACVENQLGGAALVPLFETSVSRRRWTVAQAHGLVEVALDRGEIRSGGRSEGVLEAEFELLGGSPEALFNLASDIVGDTTARLTLPSKAARGHLLAGGKAPRLPSLSRKPAAPAAGTDGGFAWASALEFLAPIVATCLQSVFTSHEPEGPHQLRVALRRLRAAIRLHRPVIEPLLAEQLGDDARLLGQIVAPLRDSDVLSETVLARAGKKADPALVAALQASNAQVRDEVRAGLRTAGATGFAVRLLGLAAIGGWRPGGRPGPRSVDALGARALGKLWARSQLLGDRLSALDDEERHEFRKSLKKLRYALEFIPESSHKKSFISSLKKLQEDLGTLNDMSVLDGWNPVFADTAAGALLAEVKSDMVEAARQKGDLALGRACRHWRDLRGRAQPWVLPTPLPLQSPSR